MIFQFAKGVKILGCRGPNYDTAGKYVCIGGVIRHHLKIITPRFIEYERSETGIFYFLVKTKESL